MLLHQEGTKDETTDIHHSSQVKQKQALSSPRVTAVDRLLEAAFCAVA
jgi:hypothetical protein